MIRALRAVCAVVALAVSSSARAAPGAATEPLMDATVSVFTLGMLRLQTRLDGLANRALDGLAPIGIDAEYDWDQDRIVIEWIDAVDGTLTGPERCKQALAAIRDSAGVDPDKGTLRYSRNHSYFAALFAQIGFVKGTAEKQRELLTQLDQVMLVRADVGLRKASRCEGPLVSSRVLYDSPR